MSQQIYLAYDGSINADWVSRYAIHMAGNSSGRKITLLHVLDGLTPLEKVKAKIELIKKECGYHNIAFDSSFLSLTKNVYSTLLEAIPAGDENYCICGMRITSRGRGFLAGTISEKLLRSKKFNILAIRIVNPGLLGCPGDLLFPLAGHPRGFQSAMPFFQMLAPCIQKVHVMRIMNINPLWFRYLSATKAKTLHNKGMNYVQKVIEEIKTRTTGENLDLDSCVVVSDDWAKEILINAGKLRIKMILLGATDRTLPSSFFYGNKIEQILRKTPCDVGMYRKI